MEHPLGGQKHPGGLEDPLGGAGAPWGAVSALWGLEDPPGGQEHPGGPEHPLWASQHPERWGWAVWDAAARPLPQDEDGVMRCHRAPLAIAGVRDEQDAAAQLGRNLPWGTGTMAVSMWGSTRMGYWDYWDGYRYFPSL